MASNPTVFSKGMCLFGTLLVSVVSSSPAHCVHLVAAGASVSQGLSVKVETIDLVFVFC